MRRRCYICDGKGWIDDLGTDAPCPKCSLAGQVAGSGWIRDNGTPVPLEETREYFKKTVAHMCPHCGYSNVVPRWDNLMVFHCKACLRPVGPGTRIQ